MQLPDALSRLSSLKQRWEIPLGHRWTTLFSATPGWPKYTRRLRAAQYCPLSTGQQTMDGLPLVDKHTGQHINIGIYMIS